MYIQTYMSIINLNSALLLTFSCFADCHPPAITHGNANKKSKFVCIFLFIRTVEKIGQDRLNISKSHFEHRVNSEVLCCRDDPVAASHGFGQRFAPLIGAFPLSEHRWPPGVSSQIYISWLHLGEGSMRIWIFLVETIHGFLGIWIRGG